MKQENNGCAPIIIGGVVLLLIGFACSHVAEQAEKLDGISNFLIGSVIVGLIVVCLYLSTKK